MSGNCQDELKKPKPAANSEPLDLKQVRARLEKLEGKQYWRSLEELADSDGFRDMLHREFPRQASVWNDGVSRRNFLQLMGASLALAGLSGCTKQPPEFIIPYVKQPEEIIPGQALYFATAMPFADWAIPMLVRSDMGRPIKAEGNPEHPAGNLGTDVFAQASLLGMYDPDRSQNVMYLGEVRTFGMFVAALQGPLAAQKSSGGAGLRFLTGASSSPTFASQMKAVLKAFPQARWHQWEAVNRDNARAGAQMAFGEVLEPQYKFEDADVILSLDADFLCSGSNPSFLRDARSFAKRRKVAESAMSRLYVAESMLTATGGKADHRIPLKASAIEGLARAVAAARDLPVLQSLASRKLDTPAGGNLIVVATRVAEHYARGNCPAAGRQLVEGTAGQARANSSHRSQAGTAEVSPMEAWDRLGLAHGAEEYEPAYQERTVKNLARTAKELASKLLPTHAGSPG